MMDAGRLRTLLHCIALPIIACLTAGASGTSRELLPLLFFESYIGRQWQQLTNWCHCFASLHCAL